MKFLKLYILLSVCFCVQFVFADNKTDSLYKLLNQKIADTIRINVYNELCWPVYSYSNIDSSIKYGEKAVALSTKIKDTIKMVIAYRRLGIAYINSANHVKALEYEQKSFDLAKAVNFKKGMSSALNNLSVIYLNISDFKKAIDYSIQSQTIQEQLRDSTNLFNSYYNTALLFKSINDYASARTYYNKALKISIMQKKLSDRAFACSGIANILKKEKKFDSAYHYFNVSEQWFLKENNLQGLSEVYINLGSLYTEDQRIPGKSNYYRALGFYRKALTLNKAYNNKITEANITGNLAIIYNNMDMKDSAIYYATRAIHLAQEANDRAEIVSSSRLLSDLYDRAGNYSQSIKYLKMHLDMKDSVYNYEKQKEIEQKQLRFEFERKAIADSLKIADEKKLTMAKLKQEQTIRYSLIFFALILLVFSYVMFNRFKIIKSQKLIIEKQKHIVDEKQKEILDSIQYAKLIQDAILENQVIMKSVISESAIFFKPKDIVSGDFYWAHKKNDFFYMAVCDCTGHGVPGAFMSLLSIGFLNEAINEEDIEKPNEIFNYVRKRLIQSINKESQKDGFDGILLCINRKTRKITYAASNNKPVLICNAQYLEFKADKMPVGQGETMQAFTLYELPAKTGDVLYLYTDGYADQFGGPKGKKFKYKPLNELLTTVSSLPFHEQEKRLKENFDNWKGNLEQVDDVCIIGMKI